MVKSGGRKKKRKEKRMKGEGVKRRERMGVERVEGVERELRDWGCGMIFMFWLNNCGFGSFLFHYCLDLRDFLYSKPIFEVFIFYFCFLFCFFCFVFFVFFFGGFCFFFLVFSFFLYLKFS